MNGITIFMEGGGATALRRAAIRQGMADFLASARSAAQKKRIAWNLTPCGSRENTLARFMEALGQSGGAVANILLVDSETAVKVTDPRVHLRSEDGWDLTSASQTSVHLMVQIMETWIVADSDALARYYGHGFRRAKLPRRTDLEKEPKARILDALKEATRHTGKGGYHKISHATQLLRRMDPAKVRSRCHHCERFFNELHRILESA